MQRAQHERRRRDPMNRLRRAAYGVLLAMGAPVASAAGAVASQGQPAPLRSGAAEEHEQSNFAALVFVQGLAAEQAQPAVFGASYSRAVLGERSEQSLSSVPLPIRSGLITVSFSDDELRRWRRGAGLDIILPDVGQFRLNFFSRGGQALKRWSLSPVGSESETAGNRNWSLAASVDWVRTQDGESRELVFIPKFVVNASELLKTQGKFDICVQYAHWRSREAGNLGRVPQAVLRWSF